MTQKRVVVIASCFMDILGQGDFRLGDAMQPPVNLRLSSGGSGRNVAENLARLGVPTDFITIMGDDTLSQLVRQQSEAVGLTIHAESKIGYGLPTYVAFNNNARDVVYDFEANVDILSLMDVAYMRQYEQVIKSASLVVVNSDLSLPVFEWVRDLCQVHQIPFVLLMGKIRSGDKVRDWLSGVTILALNLSEFAYIRQRDLETLSAGLDEAVQVCQQLGIESILLTSGADGAGIANADGVIVQQPIFPVESIESVIGAGDSFLAGYLWGMLHGKDDTRGLDYGLACASVTLQSAQTVSPNMTLETVQKLVFSRK